MKPFIWTWDWSSEATGDGEIGESQIRLTRSLRRRRFAVQPNSGSCRDFHCYQSSAERRTACAAGCGLRVKRAELYSRRAQSRSVIWKPPL